MSKPEAEYLKSNEIGLVIAKGMAVTFKHQPKNPVDFFAKWLLKEAQNKTILAEEEARMLDIKELKDKHAYDQKAEAKAEAQAKQE